MELIDSFGSSLVEQIMSHGIDWSEIVVPVNEDARPGNYNPGIRIGIVRRHIKSKMNFVDVNALFPKDSTGECQYALRTI